MELEVRGQAINAVPNSEINDDFEGSEGAQGELLSKKTGKVDKTQEMSSHPATEGATQSKLVCGSEEDLVRPEDEVLDLPSKEVSGRSSHTNLNNLLNYSPKPQPPLTEKQVKVMQKGKDQTALMIEQVNKMKRGMQKLQEITQKFNCMEKYKEDVDYLVKNLAKCLVDSESDEKDQTTSKQEPTTQ